MRKVQTLCRSGAPRASTTNANTHIGLLVGQDCACFTEDKPHEPRRRHIRAPVDMKRPIEPCYRMIGMRLEQIRTTLGVTQEEFSKRVGLTRTSIVNIEHGRQRILLHDVEKIAAALGITPKHLLRGIWT